MTLQELVDEIDRQPTWSANGTRAPHKPLTILFAIGQALAGQRMTRFAEGAPRLAALLDQFGPPRAVQHPEQPVWRLRRYDLAPTSFWQLDGPLEGIEGVGGNPSFAAMERSISFGLTERAADLLCSNPANARAVATMLAARIAPPSTMGELLEAVGVRGESSGLAAELHLVSAAVDPELVERAVRTVNTLVRDAAFSRRVRSAYGETCAICSIAPRLDGKLFGLEAAHIRWANHGGPDEVRNGVLLCRMHHHALDRGAIRIDRSMRVAISPRLARDAESDALFARFEGQEIRLPARTEDQPHPLMIDWHWNQVFKR